MVFSIILLLFSSQAILQFVINLEGSNLERIDIAGQQRMLSQKMTTKYIELKTDLEATQQQWVINDLNSFLKQIKINNESLQNNKSENRLHDFSISLIENFSKPAYFDSLEMQLYPQIIACQTNLEMAVKNINEPTQEGFITTNVLGQNKLLLSSHRYVQALQEKAHNEIRLLRAMEILLSILVIVTLIIELIYVIQPMMRRLKEQNDSLNELNEIKTRFIGMVAHDLRNPLSVIQQYSEIIAESNLEKSIEDEEKYISVIQASSKFMLDIVNELLDVSIIESNSFELTKVNTDLNELIIGAITLNKIFADKKKITLSVKLPEGYVYSSVDQSKIIQVLNNIISNAVKYSHEKTTVTTEVIQEANNVIIKISDQGQGIKASELEDLFKPFVTTSTKSTAGEKSVGLGLTIVQKIIEAHEGTISVKSEVGVGTVFEITLPFTQTSGTEIIKNTDKDIKGSKDHKYSESSPKTLVCEDDPLLQLLMKRVFKSFHINALYADNGQEGLDLIKANENIELVFTDINMPVMDGYDLAKEIKSMDREIKVVALSGRIDDAIKNKFAELGVDLCLEKPISKGELASLIK